MVVGEHRVEVPRAGGRGQHESLGAGILRHARQGTRAAFAQTLAAIPDPEVRADVDAMSVIEGVRFSR